MLKETDKYQIKIACLQGHNFHMQLGRLQHIK